MKKLDRNLAQIPECLNDLSHVTHTWKNMTSARKKRVWKELDKFQNKLCVYCESVATRGQNTGHIEHFFDKGSHKHLTFDWNNLFGCCSSTEHCGHYKDQVLPGGIQRSYNPNLLIKPDKENPEDFLQFLPSGKIKEKEGLDAIKLKKAKETIVALHLDAPSLERSREAQISHFQNKVTAVLTLMDSEETYNLAIDEYKKIEQEALTTQYRTAIKQAVTWLRD